jgi:hypothetical protein
MLQTAPDAVFRIPLWLLITAVLFGAASAPALDTLKLRLGCSAQQISSSMTVPT